MYCICLGMSLHEIDCFGSAYYDVSATMTLQENYPLHDDDVEVIRL